MITKGAVSNVLEVCTEAERSNIETIIINDAIEINYSNTVWKI